MNKQQKELKNYALSHRLRPVNPTQTDMRRCFKKCNMVLEYRNKIYCSQCGQYIGTKDEILEEEGNSRSMKACMIIKEDKKQCPICHTKFNYNEPKKGTIRDYRMMLIIQPHKDMIIFRRFMIQQTCKAREKAQYYNLGEVSQEWLKKEAVICFEKKLIMYPNWSDQPYKIWEKEFICKESLRFSGFFQVRQTSKSKILDDISPLYFGEGMTPIDIQRKYFTGDSMYETLCKKGLYKLVNNITPQEMKKFRNSIRIALKNNYDIWSDWHMYRDYLEDLKTLGLDLNSPHYLCPDDLRRRHETLNRKARVINDCMKTQAHEKEYQTRIKKYLSILLYTNEHHLLIRPIKTIKEMIIEGSEMHHCVGSYWNKKDSLILVCRTKEDKRVATIEINIERKEIVQIRGFANHEPEHYNEIKSTLRKNLKSIINPKKQNAV